MIKGLKNDVLAGFSVFLLALPLCLGIATASNFPPVAGVLSAVVGGLLVSLFGGAKLSIKGPAAGLIVIALGAVHELGNGDLLVGYERTLAVGVAAAIIQILIATTRQAVIAEIMPPSAIHGMLAAIGVIIISKQTYVMMGITPTESEPLALLTALPIEMFHLNPLIFGIGLLSLVVAIFWPLIQKLSFIPSSFVILLIAIFISLRFDLSSAHEYIFMEHMYPLGANFLINLPQGFLSALHFPDFSVIFTSVSIKYIIMFALVGSIESLLTVCAVDSMTHQSGPSDLNKDLRAVGIGNLVSSLIGGLPMISEIVRSKANIDSGATSARANFFHGLFMLVAVCSLPNVMNLIPLSALAALLISVGIKLASPKEFIHAYKIGLDQFSVFITTFFVTLAMDLLIGVAAGIFLKLIIHIARAKTLESLFRPKITTDILENSACIKIEGQLTFLSYLRLKREVVNVSKKVKEIVINLDGVTYIDNTARKKLQSLDRELENPLACLFIR